MTNKDKIQTKILEHIKPGETGRLLLAPRVGKTVLMIKFLKKNPYPRNVLWVHPSKEFCETLLEEEFKKFDASHIFGKVDTCTWTSLNKVDKIYDLVILDEEQHITSNNAQGLNKHRNIISMTGTPTKDFDKNNLIKSYIGKNIFYQISITEASELELISNNYRINVVKFKPSREKNIKIPKKAGGFFMSSDWDQQEYWNKRYNQSPTQANAILRMNKVYNSPTKMDKLLKLRELLKKKTGKVLYSCPFIAVANKFKYKYHSKTHSEDLSAFMGNEIDELAIVNAGGTGITYENLQYLVIQQASSDKNGQSTQKICRALLKQTNIVPEIYILCLLGTQDEVWVQKTLENFDQSKIREINV